ncbi:hypothetical protein ACU686_19670 [Yinghuangia aomiensis]
MPRVLTISAAPTPLTVASRFNRAPGVGEPAATSQGGSRACWTGTPRRPSRCGSRRRWSGRCRCSAPTTAACGCHDGGTLVAEAAAASDAVLDERGLRARRPGDVRPGRGSVRGVLRRARRTPLPDLLRGVRHRARTEGDGLRLFPGLLPQQPGTTATPWVPDASLADADGARVRPEFVWAALDCPGGWTVLGTDIPDAAPRPVSPPASTPCPTWATAASSWVRAARPRRPAGAHRHDALRPGRPDRRPGRGPCGSRRGPLRLPDPRFSSAP